MCVVDGGVDEDTQRRGRDREWPCVFRAMSDTYVSNTITLGTPFFAK
jgi:hypothetical protein